jgi:hypothetical protein
MFILAHRFPLSLHGHGMPCPYGQINAVTKDGKSKPAILRLRAATLKGKSTAKSGRATDAGWVAAVVVLGRSFAAAVASRCARDFNRATRKGFLPALPPGRAALPRGTGREMPRLGISSLRRYEIMAFRLRVSAGRSFRPCLWRLGLISARRW